MYHTIAMPPTGPPVIGPVDGVTSSDVRSRPLEHALDETAVHLQGSARDVPRGVREQEHGRAGELVRRAVPADGDDLRVEGFLFVGGGPFALPRIASSSRTRSVSMRPGMR